MLGWSVRADLLAPELQYVPNVVTIQGQGWLPPH